MHTEVLARSRDYVIQWGSPAGHAAMWWDETTACNSNSVESYEAALGTKEANTTQEPKVAAQDNLTQPRDLPTISDASLQHIALQAW
jgi:hypothetical protein